MEVQLKDRRILMGCKFLNGKGKLMSASNTRSCERFLYHVRGHIKNLTKGDDCITFNLEPINLYGSDMNIDGNIRPSITLIGRRLIKTKHGMEQENDVIPVLASTKFMCEGMPFEVHDGERHDLHIDDDEVQRIRSMITDPNLVVKVNGLL